MAKLILTVEGQSLSVSYDIPKIVENSIDYLTYSLKTPSDWIGYTPQVLFTHENKTVIGMGNKVPKEVIKAPGFVVTVLGKITESGVIKSQIPSSPVPVKVYPSGELKADDPSQEDFTEDWYDEVVKTIENFINSVDQDYNFESENPQSGKAVAQAVSSVYSNLTLTQSYLIPNKGNFAGNNHEYVTGYIFPVAKNVDYEISITGEHNRFFVLGCYDYPDFGLSYDNITENIYGITDALRVTNTDYNYFFVGVGYGIDTSNVSLTVKRDANSIFKNYLGKSYIETLITDFSSVAVIDSKLRPTYAGVIGTIFPVKHNQIYELTVNGYHNRFIVGGVKGFPFANCSVDIISAPKEFPNIHTFSFENDEYDYVIVNIGYNITTDATLTIREYDKSTYNLIQERNTSDVVSHSFYTANPDVSNVTTTEKVYELYDKLVTDYPSFLSMNELGSDLREYVFTIGDYNNYSPDRNIDAIIPKPVILIHSGTHGYERSAVMSTYQFFRDLCENKPYLENIRGNCTFKVIPIVCPWGFDNDSRVNANGVNLNRNYSANWVQTEIGIDYSGESASDQAETKICEKWLQDNKDALLFIDFHNSAYINEVACLMGTDGVVDISNEKKTFLKSIHSLIGYWVNECKYSNTLVFGYTGNFNKMACSYQYADSIGIKSCCLETSWQQNGETKHSNNTIRTGAEVLGNMLVAICTSGGGTTETETLNQIEAQLDEIIETQNSYIGGTE